MKLNIGCGDDYKEGWVNIDSSPYVKKDLDHDLSFLDEKFADQADFILAQDILEHLNMNKWEVALTRWVRCLKVGGKIQIQIPDPYLIFDKLVTGELTEEEVNRVIYGENTTDLDRHYQLFSLGRLKDTMKKLGLKIVEQRRINICSIVVGEKI
jgi:hypothetical protein